MITEKISRLQLTVLMMGFIFGVVINPAAAAKQDSWLAYLFSWAGGFFLIGGYVWIAGLNPGKTLVEILKEKLGKYIGGSIALIYVWYFLHLAAIIVRNFTEYIIITDYPETPMTFVIIVMLVTAAYAVRNGLEVMARTGELFIPLIPVLVILLSVFLFQHFDINSYKPFLVKGIVPVLKTSVIMLGFPFGELVIFLMIFPALNKRKDLFKTTLLALLIMGSVLFIILIRDFFILGADMLYEAVFPSTITTRLIPGLNLDALVAVKNLIGGLAKISICLYAAALGLAQVFNLNRYKPFVMPITALTAALAVWLYDSTFETLRWSTDNYFIYAFPFQILIPVILLIVSLLKRKKN